MPLTAAVPPTHDPLEKEWSRRHIQAPHRDASFVAEPALSSAIELARRNHARLAAAQINVQGKTLAELRHWSRQVIYAAARDYTAYIQPADSPKLPAVAGIEDAIVYVGGHQPTLFHPGVWVKNFVASRLAELDGGVGLNLVVDTDTLGGTSIRVPGGTLEAPSVASVAFDTARSRQPWEEAKLVDRNLFDSFADRVLKAWGSNEQVPLLSQFWPAAVRHSQRTESLAECLTAARVAWERSLGVGNLELPVSRMCQTEPFLWFAAHILAQLPRFVGVYNEVLQEYRTINRVRSRTHPVPDLKITDGWFEAPFRVWLAGDELRRRVFAKADSGTIDLSDGVEVFARLPLSAEQSAAGAVEELKKLAGRGIRFRTRALTTTLFSRLCFADLFIHGIGGAKYDQMTDRIASRFLGLAAPEFLTISATLLLPNSVHSVAPADERRLLGQLRELEFNSERHLSEEQSRQYGDLIAEKQRLIAEQQAARAAANSGKKIGERRSGYTRYRRFQELNGQLAQLTNGDRQRMQEELQTTRNHLAANAVWQNREYASCLYPAELLRRFFNDVCTQTGS